MKINEWMKEVKGIPDELIDELAFAFQALEKWEAFSQEYAWTGVKVIGEMVGRERTDRMIQQEEGKRARLVGRVFIGTDPRYIVGECNMCGQAKGRMYIRHWWVCDNPDCIDMAKK